jgi:hypothetical protein
VLSDSTERVDRLIKRDEYKALDALDYIVIIDPACIEAGFWYRDADRAWHSTTFQEADSVIDMPTLGIAISLAVLYERVQAASHSRPKLA